MIAQRRHDRAFVRTFFTSPTAVEGDDDSARMLTSAAGLRGMQAPDVWVPDNEGATAPSMREEGAENIIRVVAEHGADFPGDPSSPESTISGRSLCSSLRATISTWSLR